MIKTFDNLLSDDTLKMYNDDMHLLMGDANAIQWNVSLFNWSNEIKDSVVGCCYQRDVSDKLNELITQDLLNVGAVKSTDKVCAKHYLWDRNSGIALHGDSHIKRSVTIYMNEEWNPNWGGIFVYQNEDDNWNAVMPKFNTAVMNDQHVKHMVTHVSALSPDIRATIQCWIH